MKLPKTILNSLLLLTLLCGAAFDQSPRRKICYLNSYHEGYGSSDEVMRGVRETLARESVELRIFFLDTKRRSSEAEIKERAAEALELINQFRPDVLIASDDDAVKYVVAPNFKVGMLRFVCSNTWCENPRSRIASPFGLRASARIEPFYACEIARCATNSSKLSTSELRKSS